MTDPVLKINLLVRTEMALAQIRTRRMKNRVIIFFLMLIFVLFGVVLLNFSIYQVFATHFSDATAGLFVALINLAIAGVLFLVAGSMGEESNEEKMAKEIRNLAYAELNADVALVKNEISQVSNDLKKIRSRFSALTDATSAIVPLVSILTKAMAKKKSNNSSEKTDVSTE